MQSDLSRLSHRSGSMKTAVKKTTTTMQRTYEIESDNSCKLLAGINHGSESLCGYGRVVSHIVIATFNRVLPFNFESIDLEAVWSTQAKRCWSHSTPSRLALVHRENCLKR